VEEHSYNVIPDESRMSHYDHNETFEDAQHSRYAILELKCERKIPLWMIQIVRTFETTWDPFSKFQTGMIECYGKVMEMQSRDLISARTGVDLGIKSRLNKLTGGKYPGLFAPHQ
jgi:hypothetical protein